MASAPETAVLIVAAGSGSRAGVSGIPKQYQLIGGKAVLARTLDLFLSHPAIDAVQVVVGEGQRDFYDSAAQKHSKLRAPVIGGPTRQASVRLGLAALASDAPRRLLIHDAARPFASPALIDHVAAATIEAQAVVPVLPMSNTL